jgi:hypothetical protein
VHAHAVLQQSPWVVFPGNLQGRHAKETGPRGAVLVTADSSGITAVERLIVDVLRWERLQVDVSSAADLPAVLQLCGQQMQALLDGCDHHKPIALRVQLTGRSAAHGALFGQRAQLREELLAQAAALGGDRLWIEKVQVHTTPVADTAQVQGRADAVADLQALLAQAPEDAAFMQSLAQDLQLLAHKAPMELNEALPELRAIRAGDVSALVQAVTPALVAQLMHRRSDPLKRATNTHAHPTTAICCVTASSLSVCWTCRPRRATSTSSWVPTRPASPPHAAPFLTCSTALKRAPAYDFVHAKADMRLGATLQHGGQTLDFVRMKARIKTLQRPDGSAIARNRAGGLSGRHRPQLFRPDVRPGPLAAAGRWQRHPQRTRRRGADPVPVGRRHCQPGQGA